jgi:hypothetical protein
MEKFVQSEIRAQAIRNGTWLSSINNTLPILIVLAVSFVLGTIAVVNYCYPNCQLIQDYQSI